MPWQPGKCCRHRDCVKVKLSPFLPNPCFVGASRRKGNLGWFLMSEECFLYSPPEAWVKEDVIYQPWCFVSASSERSTSHGGPTWGSQDVEQKCLRGLFCVRLLELGQAVLPDHGLCLYLLQTSL